ncbi:ABC1 kinase family protein [Corynebacterium ulceribovis]|uniref:ABC1 kinase family protein n=1 Tax=Corynebacterium ulceribovis TaxID=487732 RepID=UPI00037A1E8C|nr:AarF/UbiB family protein [Corynebacterium ulceribovis]
MIFLGTVVNVLLLAFLSRQLLAVPVGWGRTLVISVIINAVTFPSLEAIFRSVGVENVTYTTPLVLFSLLLAGWALTFQLIILTVLEALVPTVSVPPMRAVVMGLPGMIRRTRRYLQVWWILIKHGLIGFTSKAGGYDKSLARSLKASLVESGVTFIKLGQMLSTRSDLLPKAFIDELSTLQMQVPSTPWKNMEPSIVAAIGGPVDEVFAEFDTTPMAAASLAQVYAATLPNGDRVVVKALRPGARAQAKSDLEIILRIADRLEKRTDWGSSIGALSLAEGFAESLDEELDYRFEVANMRAIAKADQKLGVPHPYEQLSDDKVLVMERLGGIPLAKADALIAQMPDERRQEMAKDLVRGVLRQVLLSGVFHADLHPGNIVVEKDCLGLLDFGSVGRLDRPTRDAMARLFVAVGQQDPVGATDCLIELLGRPENLDVRALQQDVGQLIMRYAVGGEVQGARLFGDMLALVVSYKFQVPVALATAFRAIGGLEGSLTKLVPDLDMIDIATEQGAAIMRDRLEPRELKAHLERETLNNAEIAARMPRRIDQITRQLEEGRMRMVVPGVEGFADQRWLTGLVQQIILAVLAASAGLGGVYLLASGGGPDFLPKLTLWEFLGLTILLVSFVLGTRILVNIFRQDTPESYREIQPVKMVKG